MLNRLLLPASDLGVALQVAVLVAALIVGVGMLLLGLVGLRAAP